MLRGYMERIFLRKDERKATEGNVNRTGIISVTKSSPGNTIEKYQYPKKDNLAHGYRKLFCFNTNCVPYTAETYGKVEELFSFSSSGNFGI